jgi:guanosine-3',5'-bis(diphosphate) 3'-pyrophosphohydrolase
MEPVQHVLQAAHFAAEKHANQKRKGAAGEPYINHLLEVAQLVSSAISEPDPNLVIAALLHDTIEDAGVTSDELVQRFGSDVADLVIEVTDDKSLPKAERKRLQNTVDVARRSRTFRRSNMRAQIIKLADKIANMRSILSSPPAQWNHERKKQYFEWSKQVIAGLSSPSPVLIAEFEKTLKRFDELQG